MSDLQTDIETVANGFGCGHTTAEQDAALENVEEAARMWVNPNIEQIAQRLHNQRIRGVKCYESFPEECTCMADTEAIVAAAPTPQGDPDG